MTYPSPDSGYGQQPGQPAREQQGQQPVQSGGFGGQQFAQQPQQGYPPAEGQGQYVQQQWQYAPAPRPSMFAALSLNTRLGVGVVLAAILAWLLSLFADRVVSVDYSLVAGLLAAVTLLPEKEKGPKVPKVAPFVAVISVLAGLLSIRTVVYSDFGLPTVLGVIVFVLIMLQMLAAIAVVLLDYGVLVLAPSGPRPPRPPRRQKQAWAGPQQGYPGQGAPQQGAPMQSQGGAQQPPQQQQPPPPQQQAPASGNFEPMQFDSGQQQSQQPPTYRPPSGDVSQTTKQFTPPPSNYEG